MFSGPPIPSVQYTQGQGHSESILAPSPFKVARPILLLGEPFV
jgi:hypothetical protein